MLQMKIGIYDWVIMEGMMACNVVATSARLRLDLFVSSPWLHSSSLHLFVPSSLLVVIAPYQNNSPRKTRFWTCFFGSLWQWSRLEGADWSHSTIIHPIWVAALTWGFHYSDQNKQCRLNARSLCFSKSQQDNTVNWNCLRMSPSKY